jgi:hypothetical protein
MFIYFDDRFPLKSKVKWWDLGTYKVYGWEKESIWVKDFGCQWEYEI